MGRRKKGNPVHGWINFNKPVGMSSNQAVSYIRHLMGAQKAGHGGTLDPLAEGVLPIALGEATKILAYMLNNDKYYTFRMAFGSETTTDDTEGDVINTSDTRPTKEEFLSAMHSFQGEISQMPPIYSALKIDGKRACDRARDGQEVILQPRNVTIHEITLDEFTENEATLSVHVSKGTYVRSLSRDLGQKLGCYAHVNRLIRTKVDKFTLDDGISKETLDLCIEKGHDARTHLLEVDVLLDSIPVYTASADEIESLFLGKPLADITAEVGQVRVKNDEGRLISLAIVNDDKSLAIIRNFPLLTEASCN
jgi:tRNA pseudouridine55 synthase